MVGDGAFASEANRRTALTAMARIGFGARGLIYLLVGAFAVAAAFNLGNQPHGIVDAVQAVTNGGVRLILAAVRGCADLCRGHDRHPRHSSRLAR
jgi:di/tricarboxylate transporter